MCPIHAEENPSFYVYPNNRFKCYGCGEGGDPADFVQAYYGYDFIEALKFLGIETELSEEEKEEIEEKKRIKAARIQRERDLIHTLSVLIRGAHKCSEYIHLLPAWEFYHDILARGAKEEKDEVIEGLRDMAVISRNPLFEPDFNYKNWLYSFLYDPKGGNNPNTGEDHARVSTQQNNNLRPVP